VIPTPGVPVVTFPASAEDGDRASVTVDALPGQMVATNAMTVPQLVDLSGARFVGIDAGRHNVVELDADVTPGAARITMSAAHPLPVVLGQVLSLIGIAGLAANGAAMLAAARRRRV
jgi:myo-inositol-hexaphosphate 3-phosphohydrolase